MHSYISSLKHAIETPCPEYEKLGLIVDGQYQQLSSNILQIENEYYSTVRPKQIVHKYEKPIEALRTRGVRYVELRSLDVNAFHPLGIDEVQLHFLQTFMLFCLCHESPNIDENEKLDIDTNEMLTAHKGRDPALRLTRNGTDISIKDWGNEVLDEMQGFAELMDVAFATTAYSQSLKQQKQAINDPECTPSARMLDEMREKGEGFYQYAMRMSRHHQYTFASGKLSEEKIRFYQELAKTSIEEQLALEKSDSLSYATFIQRYFANTLSE